MTKRKWTKTSVVRAIRAWHRQGGLLSTVWKEDSSLHSGAAACFGTWRKALEAAGFPCARRIWSPELVLAAIRDRHQRQLSLSGVQRDDRFLFAAACRHFGGWHNALAAAGLSLERPRKWTPERVLDAIRGWQREGRPLTSVRQTDKPLYAAAARLFGTWLNAVLAAGLPMKQLRRWTKEDVLAAIHEARARGLTTAEISTQNPSLCGAAKRHFGGWRGAMVAAGVPVEMPRRWNRATVIAAIQAHSRSGFALSQVWRRDKPLFRAATRWFGNWEHALSAAGLPGKIRRRWSQTRVIQELRAWYPQPQPNLRRGISAVRRSGDCLGSRRPQAESPSLAAAASDCGDPGRLCPRPAYRSGRLWQRASGRGRQAAVRFLGRCRRGRRVGVPTPRRKARSCLEPRGGSPGDPHPT